MYAYCVIALKRFVSCGNIDLGVNRYWSSAVDGTFCLPTNTPHHAHSIKMYSVCVLGSGLVGWHISLH